MRPRASELDPRLWRAVYALAIITTLGLVLPLPSKAFDPSKARPEPWADPRRRAIYLFHIARFVEWPVTAFGERDTLHLCVIGQTPVARALEEAVKGRRIHSRMPLVRTPVNTAETAGCHLVYLGVEQSFQLRQFLRSLEGLPILTVGELPMFTERGGMINFVRTTKKLTFEINQEAARRGRLRISSQLLRVASKVRVGGGR